jgi:hypothetical protein
LVFHPLFVPVELDQAFELEPVLLVLDVPVLELVFEVVLEVLELVLEVLELVLLEVLEGIPEVLLELLDVWFEVELFPPQLLTSS